jgi:hypothetical protein
MARKAQRLAPLLRARKEFAEDFDAACRNGHRPEGGNPAKPWTNKAFSDSLASLGDGSGPTTVGTWRNVDKPSVPGPIGEILDVLYGDKFPASRQKLLDKWRAASNLVPLDDPPDQEAPDISYDWDDRQTLEPCLRGVQLGLHRPMVYNPDNLRIEGLIHIEPGEYYWENQPILIGVREPYLAIEPGRYDVTKQSLVSERDKPNFEPAGRAAKIIKPVDGRGRIKGDPLGADYIAVVEPCDDSKKEEVTVTLSVSQRGFDITKTDTPDTEVMHPNRDAILNRLIIAGYEIDKRTGRVVIARARMRRKPRPDA